LQMLVSEALPPLLDHLVAHCTERLTVKQAARGNIIIGGGWQAQLDTGTRRTMPTVEALRGNLGVACRTLPMLRDVRIIRTWTAMNVGTVGPPIISATPGHPWFVHVATANGLTMAPVVGRICADLLLGRDPQYDVAPFDLDRAR
jgi:glycine/D-amino acid oxidase-like deaminating enzyme